MSRYRIYPATGAKANKLCRIADDLEIAIGKVGIRTMLLQDSIGIGFEIPNEAPIQVPLELLLHQQGGIGGIAESD